MSNIEIRFVIRLESDNAHHNPNGPLFFRYLPNDEADSIEVLTGHEAYRLFLWFERRGYVSESGLIEWDAKRREVPPDLIVRQGILEAGPLFGRLQVSNCTEAELNALRTDETGAAEYISFAKRCLDIIVPHASRLIRILRDTYGQYWIPELHTWDSRRTTLGAYCRNVLQMSWRETNENEYRNFLPTLQQFIVSLQADDWDDPQYIKTSDWHKIRELMKRGYDPSLVSSLMARTNELLEEGETRHAVVEAVTVIEIVIADLLTRSAVDKEELNLLWTAGLRNRLTSVAAARGDLDRKSLENMLELIDLRNRIVHEGYVPKETSRILVHQSLLALRSWMEMPLPRFPRANHGNRVWGKDEGSESEAPN